MNDGYEKHQQHEGQETAKQDSHSPGAGESLPIAEPGGAWDRELLAAVQYAISTRGDAHDEIVAPSHDNQEDGLGDDKKREIASIRAFSARLAATAPRMDERFHDELLARLGQELLEPLERETANQASTVAPQVSQAAPDQHPQPSRNRKQPSWPAPLSSLIDRLTTLGSARPRTWAPLGKMGRAASAVTAMSGVAVVLLVLAGMAGMLKLRQDANQSNKNAIPALTQTAIAGGPGDGHRLVEDLRLLYTLTGTGSIAWPAGNSLMTSGGTYGSVQTWDTTTGRLIHSVKTEEGGSRVLAPDGGTLAVVSGRTIKLLDAASGQEVQSWAAPEEIGTLAWSPDSSSVATGAAGAKGVIRLWEVATGKELLSFSYAVTPYSAFSPGLTWSPDGHILAVGGGLAAAELWDTSSGKLVRSIGPEYPNTVRAILALTPSPTPLSTPAYRDVGGVGTLGLAWSPDGRYIATSYARTVTVWDAISGQELRTVGAPVPYDDYTSVWDSLGWVSSMAWSRDSKVLAVANGSLTLWDVATGTLLRTLPGTEPVGRPSAKQHLAMQATWSPGGRELAVGYADSVEIWGTLAGVDASATPSAAIPASASPRPDCGSWQIVPSTGANTFNRLMGVAATSPDDAWAVGFHSNKRMYGWLADAYVGEDTVHTLIEHWDGNTWSVVPSPDANGSSYLFGVAATNKSDAWAVGYYTTADNIQQTLILGWNGTQWRVVSSPNVSGEHNRLTAVTALAWNDVWAVGSSGQYADFNSGPSHTLILHFDGVAWSIVSSPSPGVFSNHLTAVSAAAPNDVWAVGFNNPEQLLITYLALHWDGKKWETVPLPQVEAKPPLGAASGVAATANGAWITRGWGDIGGGSWQVAQYAAEGSSSITSPNLRTGRVVDIYLSGVIAGSSDNVWAVGSIAENTDDRIAPPDLPSHDTLVLHWDGSNWSVMPSQSNDGQDNELSAVALVPGAGDGSMWAVGSSATDSGRTPLILRYRGCATAKPNLTATPSTATPSTATPAATITPGNSSPTAVPRLSVPRCGLTWSLLQMPPSSGAGGSVLGHLAGVAAISPNDVWTVGYEGSVSSSTHTAHWDGSAWNTVASPNIGTGDNKLYEVAALASNDVWAVGSYSSGPTDTKPLIVHWDGGAWNIVPNPDPGPGQSALYAVAAISPNDVWAVGSVSTNNEPDKPRGRKSRTLIEHWDGTRWSVVSSPDPGNLNNSLSDVTAVSKDDVWAVGSFEEDETEFVGFRKTLVLHWDGTSWTQVPSPNVETWMNGLSAVDARTADDVWAVGATNGGEHLDPLTMHWDGRQWSIVPSPKSGSHNGGVLGTVAVLSANDVWAMGSDSSFPTAMHWNGSMWENVLLPVQTQDGGYILGGLSDIAVVSPTEMWGVGSLQNDNDTTAFMMRYSNVPCVTPGPTTPATPTPRTRLSTSPTKSGPTGTLTAAPNAAAKSTPVPVCRTWHLAADVDVGAPASSITAAAAVSPGVTSLRPLPDSLLARSTR